MKSVHSDEHMDKFETDPITIDENDEMIQPHQIKVELELEQGKITFFASSSLYAINYLHIL